MEIDLNAARAARREGKGDEITVALGSEAFVFPIEYPLALTDLARQAVDEEWTNDRYVRAQIETLMGSEAWQRFLAIAPSQDDFYALYDALMGAYGLKPGESGSSPDSSAPGGERSKPSSNGSTGSTRGRSSRAKAQVRAVS